MSLKVKCDGAIGIPIYGFLLMFNSNMAPNQGILRDIRFPNHGNLNFDFSGSPKVKSNGAVRLPMYSSY